MDWDGWKWWESTSKITLKITGGVYYSVLRYILKTTGGGYFFLLKHMLKITLKITGGSSAWDVAYRGDRCQPLHRRVCGPNNTQESNHGMHRRGQHAVRYYHALLPRPTATLLEPN